jgi:translation initiation factor 3 subunit G
MSEIKQQHDEEGIPEDQDFIDPSTGIRTIITHYKREDGKLVRVTRKLEQQKKSVKVHRAVRERRKNLAKFGDVAGFPSGLEPNVSYVDHQLVNLRLDGQKEEEKAEVEELLSKISSIKGGKGFLFKQSEKVREKIAAEEKDEKTEQVASAGASASGRFVPKALGARPGAAGGKPSRFDDDLPTVRVGNLTENASQSDVWDLFVRFGQLSRVRLATDPETRASRGYAFVTFYRKEDAQRAIDALNGHGYDNLILQVEWAKSMAQWKSDKLSSDVRR